jgi:hypothetical protein
MRSAKPPSRVSSPEMPGSLPPSPRTGSLLALPLIFSAASVPSRWSLPAVSVIVDLAVFPLVQQGSGILAESKCASTGAARDDDVRYMREQC